MFFNPLKAYNCISLKYKIRKTNSRELFDEQNYKKTGRNQYLSPIIFTGQKYLHRLIKKHLPIKKKPEIH